VEIAILRPIYTENESGVARRNPLFVILRRVILRSARLGTATPGCYKTNKELRLATPGWSSVEIVLSRCNWIPTPRDPPMAETTLSKSFVFFKTSVYSVWFCTNQSVNSERKNSCDRDHKVFSVVIEIWMYFSNVFLL